MLFSGEKKFNTKFCITFDLCVVFSMVVTVFVDNFIYDMKTNGFAVLWFEFEIFVQNERLPFIVQRVYRVIL